MERGEGITKEERASSNENTEAKLNNARPRLAWILNDLSSNERHTARKRDFFAKVIYS